MIRQLLLAFFVAAPLLAGGACARGSKEEAARQALQQYAELPGLSATHHQGLQEELARLRSEEATPTQLDASRQNETAPADVTTSVNASAGRFDRGKVDWSHFFHPQSLATAANRIDAAYPTGDLPLTPIQLTAVIAQRSSYEAQRQRFERLIDAPDFHPGWLASEGLAADTSFVEVARLCARLEGLLAVEMQQKGQLDAALDAFGRMMDIARFLAAERQMVSRIGAVHVRRDALTVLARIVQHPACKGSHRRLAMNRIATELEKWPADRRAWVGDRALGLHVYEMVRDGQLAAVLTEDERVRIRRAASLDELQQAVQANVDNDEMVYLKLMRRLVDACDRPYYQRRDVLDAIGQELFELRDSTEYPFVADTILLTDVDKAHRLQAVDRARMDAWLLALQAATSNAPPPSPAVNPLTGEPFRLSVEPSRFIVEGIDPGTTERVVIPVTSSD